MKHLKKTLMIIGAALGVLFLSGVIFVVVMIVSAPNLSEVDATPEGYLSTILDNEGNVVDTLYVAESNRVYVELQYIPENLQNAFVAIEDARFYEHHGIDLRGIARAFVTGIREGNFSQGASTITQQLLKNNVFTDWMSEESFFDSVCRKIQEQYLAIRLEQKYSKEWILENYLNTINLGGGTRGVQVASKYYFGKDVSELTLAESALIAGITKSPTAYNPLLYPENSIARQGLVLDAMLAQEMIAQEAYDQAKEEDVLGKLIYDASQRDVKVFSWFEDALLVQVVEDLMAQYKCDEATAWDMIYAGGLTIYSTQDSALQALCEAEAVKDGWYDENQQISLVMTDVSTGAVAAIVGGSDPKTESLSYHRATEAVRQPGSTIKILGEYAAALDTGAITLGTVMDDEPYAYSDGTPIGNAYSTYQGMTTIRDAIVDSGNVLALKTYQMVGENKVMEYLQKFGITTLTEEDMNESLAIGGTYHGVTNLELTGAYNAIANGGSYVRPYFYTKVVDSKGNVILQPDISSTQVVKPSTAALLTSAMEDVLTSGTGTQADVPELDLAGKSGTTNEKRDLWFVGFSCDYTLGIWGGHDNNGAQGDSVYVKKLWQSIMKQAHGGQSAEIVNTEGLVKVNICKKCGNLAVDGLCDVTLQGDMTQNELFVRGTQPIKKCDCHVKVSICKETGAEARFYCPDVEENVYLYTGTEGTIDAECVLPPQTEGTCEIHTNILDKWFEQDETEEETNSWEFPWFW